MSKYGFLGGLNGYITEGFRSFNLHAHGRAKLERLPSNVTWYYPEGSPRYHFVFHHPPVPKEEVSIAFVLMEKDNPRSYYSEVHEARKVEQEGATMVRVPQMANNKEPYVYIYTTKIVPLQKGEYGLEIYGKEDNIVFSSNINPMRICSSESMYLTDGKPRDVRSIANKEVAINISGEQYRIILFPDHRFGTVTQGGLTRKGDSFHWVSETWRQDFNNHYPYNDYDWASYRSLAIIDVSHIKRNE